MTWLEFTNKVFLQWFCIRLTRCQHVEVEEFKLDGVSLMQDNEFSIMGKLKRIKTFQWYAIQYWIAPLSGWNGPFRYLGKTKKPKFRHITKKRKVT